MTRARLALASLVLANLCSLTPPAFGQYPESQDQFPPQGSQQANQQSAPDDEPGRAVARLSLMNGDASVRRGDSGNWVAASVNAPLMVQDSVSVGPGGYAEIQFDSANFVRVAGDSEIRISTLDSGRFGVQVIKGLVTYRVLRQSNTQSEVATPQVAVRPGPGSAVRVELLADGVSSVSVRAGEADVYTPKGVEKVRSGGMMMVRGDASDPEYQITAAAAIDDWDHFNEKRDQDLLSTRSNQYVSRDMYGTEDLDRNGQWVNDPQYGNVWAPTVSADWAPYRDGRWVWEDYYGWTWVAYEPWGWAPYHYGSWYYRGGGFGWCWFPGRSYERAFWRPALVGFFGFGGWRGGLGVGIGFGGGIGWVPLAPYERFHPWYGRGWSGGRNVVNNTTIVNNTNITNIYRNARVSNGVSGLGAREFSGGQFHSIRPLGPQNLQSANLVRGALPMQPSQSNFSYSNRAASASVPHVNPPAQQRFASTRMSPPSTIGTSARAPFAQQQSSFAGSNRSPASVQGSTSNTGGWQRFGSTPNAPSQNGFSGRAAASGSSAPGWQRFGTPQSSSNARPSTPSQNWNSFGRPASPRQAAPQSSPQYSPQSSPQYSPQRNYQQNSSPQSSPQRGYYAAPSAPRYSAPQNNYQGGGRSIQIAPPMVQQRSQQQYAPQQQQRSAPSYSRPSGGGGGGGGGSRPSGGGSGGGRAPSGSSGHGRR